MANARIRVVLLAGPRESSRIMYHGLAHHVDIQAVVLEDKVPAAGIIQRRIKRLGFAQTLGQLLFIAVNKIMRPLTRVRKHVLLERYGLCVDPISPALGKRIQNVNSATVVELLQAINPDAVVVNGTRIISKKILNCIDAPFINSHLGITPKYRGVHGGYWALTQKDPENCGVTVHLVDEGIDTGGVLYQDIIRVEPEDSFNTYPIHQIAKAIPLMRAALSDVAGNTLNPVTSGKTSRLWYHPTLSQYIRYRVAGGVK